jgi:hypothetical protein
MGKSIAWVVLSLGVFLGACAQAFEGASSGPYEMEVVGENGVRLPTFERGGRTYVLGNPGQRYLLRVRNQTGRRIEVVASVDGRDVRDGRPATLGKRGYLVDAYGEILLDGFRVSQESVAAFRFSSVAASYASQMGNAREVGVVGAAIFTERVPLAWIPREPVASPPPASAYQADMAPSASVSARAEANVSGGAPAAAPAPQASAKVAQSAPAQERAGLGTEFGEQHASHMDWVAFERASSSPAAILTARYNNRAGLIALGIDVDGDGAQRRELWLRESAQPFARVRFSEPPPGWRP